MSEAVSHSRIEGLVVTPVEEVKRFSKEGEALLEKGECKSV